MATLLASFFYALVSHYGGTTLGPRGYVRPLVFFPSVDPLAYVESLGAERPIDRPRSPVRFGAVTLDVRPPIAGKSTSQWSACGRCTDQEVEDPDAKRACEEPRRAGREPVPSFLRRMLLIGEPLSERRPTSWSKVTSAKTSQSNHR